MAPSPGLLARLDRLVRSTERLAELATQPVPAFREDWRLEDAAARNLEVAAQACIDIANHLIARCRLASPSTGVEAVLLLGEHGIITQPPAASLVPFLRLRNRLAHEYVRVTATELWAALQDLQPFRRFAVAVEALESASEVRERRVGYGRRAAASRRRPRKVQDD